MVNSQAGDLAFLDQSKKKLVNLLENFGQLHAQGNESGHIKKAAVIDFFGSGAPGRELIVLRLKQSMQLVRQARAGRGDVESPEGRSQCLADSRRILKLFSQAPLNCGTILCVI